MGEPAGMDRRESLSFYKHAPKHSGLGFMMLTRVSFSFESFSESFLDIWIDSEERSDSDANTKEEGKGKKGFFINK